MQNNAVFPDHNAIGVTASVLGASELRVFELAYQEWYGKPPQIRDAERAFVDYLLEGKVPCWVRAFTRNTLHLCEEAGIQVSSRKNASLTSFLSSRWSLPEFSSTWIE